MFEVGQKVTVITDKLAYDGIILARATGDNGPGAYKITLDGAGPDQMGQWHKAGDVFLREEKEDDTEGSWENLSGQ
ncbi:MAG: hypothetical protein ABSC48_03580 [Terracidiphilus sp.]|jgi:hypothetical protein